MDGELSMSKLTSQFYLSSHQIKMKLMDWYNYGLPKFLYCLSCEILRVSFWHNNLKNSCLVFVSTRRLRKYSFEFHSQLIRVNYVSPSNLKKSWQTPESNSFLLREWLVLNSIPRSWKLIFNEVTVTKSNRNVRLKIWF